jgi:GTP cyclohydrolase II
MEKEIIISVEACSNIPTIYGDFSLCLYNNNLDENQHLAFIKGDLDGYSDVLVRVHSECFTGDLLGSQRCDCGEQLDRAIQMIAQEPRGAIIYMRQEGRGIGLAEKLKAYNLQDQGFDTVDANLILGHQADSRDYSVTAAIIKDLGLKSIRLLTNNPSKIEQLENLGIEVAERVSLIPTLNQNNARYLQTKAERMNHLLDPSSLAFSSKGGDKDFSTDLLKDVVNTPPNLTRPAVTLAFAQSLDGSIALEPGVPYPISSPESLRLTHQLRASHDAILIGIGTVISDNPSLTVREVQGDDPQPVILDSTLRFPLDAKMLNNPVKPWIFGRAPLDVNKKAALESRGARVFSVEPGTDIRVNLDGLLALLAKEEIANLMVEGGAQVISSFLKSRLPQTVVLTISAQFLGGLNPIDSNTLTVGGSLPQLEHPRYEQLGEDVWVWGRLKNT